MKKNAARKNAYKAVDLICYNRDNIRKAVYEARLDPHNERTGSNSGAHINDPTANKALADIKPLPKIVLACGTIVKKPELWLNIIDYVYNQCLCEIEQKIFNERWKEKNNANRISSSLFIDRTTYYDIVNNIKSCIVELGCQMGVLRVYSKKNKLIFKKSTTFFMFLCAIIVV